MSSGIKKRTGSEYSDGRHGRINYHSEDEYRTITLLVQSTAYDMQDVAHLRDAVNELFDGELMLREMRIKSVEVEYESPGQRTGELQLESPEYVNGKQIKVAMVNSPEIDDTTLVSTFTVEFETTESPYFESMYTTVDIHNLTDEQFTKQFGNVTEKPTGSQAIYRTVGEKLIEFIDISAHSFENSFVSSSDGSYSIGGRFVANPKLINITPGIKYTFEDSGTANNLSNWWLYFYDANGEFLSSTFTSNKTLSFTPKGTKMRIMAEPEGSTTFSPQDIGTILKPRLNYTSDKQVFTVYNGGNVLVEPEFMFLEITIGLLETPDVFTVKNKTTGDVFEWKKPVSGRNIYLKGMNISEGTAFNGLRETNRKFIRLAPGVNRFEVWGGTFKTITFNTKFYFK